jgi:GntR family transcriptional regulator
VLEIHIDPDRPLPPSGQLVEAVLDAIVSGRLDPETRLPSVRGLAKSARVNPNTVVKAYGLLEAMGVVRSEQGRGSFIEAAGVGIARQVRQANTRDALVLAIQQARASGHSAESIRSVVEEQLSGAPVVHEKESRS